MDQALSSFETNLVCGVCLELIDTPFSFSECGHTFCKECLPKSCDCSLKSQTSYKNKFFEQILIKMKYLKQSIDVGNTFN